MREQESENEGLVRVHVETPHSCFAESEGLWALPLGDNRYEVRNIPFCAYGLNLMDVVLAKERGEMTPLVKSVEQRSGHTTLRMFFDESFPEGDRIDLLKTLNPHRAYFENANGSYFALDVEPDGDIGAVREKLYEWEEKEWCSYETCEERVAGSFGDHPETS